MRTINRPGCEIAPLFKTEHRWPVRPGSLVAPRRYKVTIVVISIGVLALCVAAGMLARAAVPARTVAQMLYETEHNAGGAPK